MLPSISAVSYDSPQLSLRIILTGDFTPRTLPFCGGRAAPASMHESYRTANCNRLCGL